MKMERKRRMRFALGIGLICVAAAMFAAVPLLQAAGVHSTGASLSPQTRAAARAASATCTGDSSLTFTAGAPPSSEKPVRLLSITWTAVNDEDNGFAGFWALDTYTVVLTVWLLKSPPAASSAVPSGALYYFLATFSGNFIVPQGGVSPGGSIVGVLTGPNAVPEPASGYGTLAAMEFGYITNAEGFAPGVNPVTGSLGTLNYSGTMSDVLKGTLSNGQVGDANAFDWYTTYFSPADPYLTNFFFGSANGQGLETGWGFTYVLNKAFTGSTSADQWCNFGDDLAGDTSYGDIVTQAGTTPPT